MKKYTQLYASELGLGAHGYILPMEITFSYNQAKIKQVAQLLLEAVAKENSGKKLLIHCFSNNGLQLYKHVSELLKNNPHG